MLATGVMPVLTYDWGSGAILSRTKYEFTLLATLLQNNLNVIECAKHSQLKELLKEDGILMKPVETPSTDSVSTSILPILPDFCRSLRSRSNKRPSV